MKEINWKSPEEKPTQPGEQAIVTDGLNYTFVFSGLDRRDELVWGKPDPNGRNQSGLGIHEEPVEKWCYFSDFVKFILESKND